VDPRYFEFFELFNRGLYYESHEVLEELWQEEADDRRARFFQGLIQYAGLLKHLSEGNARGAASVLAKARANLAPLAPTFLGVDLDRVLQDLARRERQLEQWAARGESPRLIDPPRLTPSETTCP
jgi:predicted metal-dependent hydrolase